MKKIFLLLPIFYACFFCSCKQGGSGEAYNIQMRLNPGDSFHQNIAMNMQMGVAGMESNMKMNSNCSFNVIKSDTSGKELKITYQKVHIAMDMGKLNGMNHMADSVVNKTSNMLTGKSVMLKLNNHNEITDVQGFDELMSANSDTASHEILKKIFSKEQANSMFGMTFNMYPEKPVRVGDSWEGKKTVNMGGLGMEISYKYTLKSVKDGFANIDMEGTIGGKGQMSQVNMPLNMDMSGTQKGTITIRMDNGYVNKAGYKTDAQMKMDVMGQKLIMNMKMDMTINGM